MSEEWMKAAVWGLVTLAMLIVLWSSWRTYRADQAKLKKLQDFRERYDVEMTQLYRWFASDVCALMVLDWLDLQLASGDLRPDGSRRLEVAIHGLQAVRQAVRDSHFNDRCRGAADASCSMPVPNQVVLTPSDFCELRNAWWDGLDIDVFMAVCLNELYQGRQIQIISERKEYLNPHPSMAPFDIVSEPKLKYIVNDLGQQVWPRPEELFREDACDTEAPARVQVTYELIKPTVDEKVDEILRVVRALNKTTDNVVNITGCASKEQAAEIVRHFDAGVGTRVPAESLVPLQRPVPSGWVVKRFAAEPHVLPDYLGPLEGWHHDARRAVLFGNKEAAIAAQATLAVDSKLPISVVWMVYDEGLGNYLEQLA